MELNEDKTHYKEFSILQLLLFSVTRERMGFDIIGNTFNNFCIIKNPNMIAIRKLSLILLGVLILTTASIISFSLSASTQQVIVNVAPTPYYSGYYPQGSIGITTTGSSATFNLYLFNPTFTQESVPIYVNSSLYTTVTLSPYSYQAVPISLSVGNHVITVEGQTLYVNVAHSSYSPITTYINGTANVYVLNAQPGKTYSFQVSFPSSTPNGTMNSFVYTDLGFYKPTTYQQGATPYLTPQNTFLLQVPKGIAQGIYYAYVYTEFENATNGALLSYSMGIIIVNVSYGLSSTLPSATQITENGVTLEMQNMSGSTYLYIEYPFSYENSYTISTPSGTIQIGNQTETNNAFPSFIGTPQLLYYGSTVPVAISPEGVLVKLPQFSTATITIKSPSGTTTLTIPPKVTIAKLNIEAISTNGSPIPNAKVSIYNITSHSTITTQTTNSSGFASYSLPIGSNVNVTVSAPGYFTNSTSITVSGTTTVKVYLTPIKITVTPIKFTENGSSVKPVQVTTQEYNLTNVTVGSTVSIVFSVSINGQATPNVTARLNQSKVSVMALGNGEYEVTQTFTAPGNYVLTINVSYNGVSQTLTTLIHVQKIVITTTTSGTTTATTSSSTTTTTSTTSTALTSTTTASSQTTTTPSTSTPSTTSSSFPITDVIIIVVVIVIAAIAAIVVLRR